MHKYTFLKIFLVLIGILAITQAGQAKASAPGGASGGGRSSFVSEIFFTPLMDFHGANDTFFSKIYKGSINIVTYPFVVIWNTGYRITRGPVPEYWIR